LKLPRVRHVILFSFVLILSLSACKPQTSTPVTSPTLVLPTEPQPTLTPTVDIPTDLVICTAQEPLTLYPYGSDNRSMWSVLEAIYDGPIDLVDFTPQPVILKEIPSEASGSVVSAPVNVKAGDLVLNASGEVVPLLKDTVVLPAGCRDESCALQWDGAADLELPQLSVTFNLIDGILWSDGTPLTMADSVYSFKLASDPATPVNRFYVERTASYTSGDSQTLTWIGIPGFATDQFEDLFWLPLPEHVWGQKSAADLLTDPVSTRQPLGWGPYQIVDWVAGNHILLARNPNYFRSAEGLPKFETLTFQFLSEHADSNLKGLEIGECDLVDSTVALDEQLLDVVEQSNLGGIKAYFGQGPEWEHLDFGIQPASYDDGYQPGIDRPDWFGDVRMRQAFAYCSDRETIANRYFFNRSSVPVSFYPPTHPAFDASLSPLPYDPSKGTALLQELGWQDNDQNAATPRVAVGVPNVVDGTALILDYVTTQSDLRVQVATDMSNSLAGCGIQVNVRHIFPAELYAAGPEGVMFGRNFDLAQFTWQSGRQSPCFLYTKQQIPSVENLWVGTNVSGYQNEDYDLACQLVLNDSSNQRDAVIEVQSIFNEELPVLPLYYQLKIAASRPDFCGLDSLDVSARSILYGLESFGYGLLCSAQ